MILSYCFGYVNEYFISHCVLHSRHSVAVKSMGGGEDDKKSAKAQRR